jgi:catechol 2,3-dioxygenase-like lactoylglutathione lyase family enzyme
MEPWYYAFEFVDVRLMMLRGRLSLLQRKSGWPNLGFRNQPSGNVGKELEEQSMDYDFDHVHIIAGDVDAMLDYFERVLGAKRLSYNPDFNGAPGAFVGLGSIRVGIRGIRPGETMDAVGPVRVQGLDHFGVVVSDLEETAKVLKERGAEFSIEPMTNAASGRMIAFVRGPENVEIELLGPLP